MNDPDPQQALGRAAKLHRHAGPLAAASGDDSQVTESQTGFRLFLLEQDRVQDLTFHEFSAIPSLLDHKGPVWLHVQGARDAAVQDVLSRSLGLHPLALEDAGKLGQRPKVEEYPDHLFVILSCPRIEAGRLSLEQVSLALTRDRVISFCHGREDPFVSIRERLAMPNGYLRRQPVDGLFHALLDWVVDQGFPVLDHYTEEMELLENLLLKAPNQHSFHQIHRLRRELLLLRHVLWPQREMISRLARDEQALIRPETRLYLRDCYDHALMLLDLLETARDMASNLLEVYLSSESNRLNENMRFLTVIATVFMPLTFIVGVYGMNFHHPESPWAMPELSWYYGYPLLWLIMILIGVGMFRYFRRRRWL